jgi:hypothetical protein
MLVSELVAYQAERLPSGLLRYGAPGGQHDDTVMALAMAWSAVSGQHRLIYPIPDSEIVVQEFPVPEHWPRAYGLDIRWNTVVAIWGAHDPESDVLYLYSEYKAGADPAIHAAAIRSRGRMHTGRLKVFASLSKYLEERRVYRRDEREQIVKDRDNLQDAARCLVGSIPRMRTKPAKSPPEPAREYFGKGGWMAV